MLTRQPTTEQQRRFGQMLNRALIEIRTLARQEKSEQVRDLANALHSLPGYMFSCEFDWALQRSMIEEYAQKYPPAAGSICDYLALFDEIEELL
jgi:hypothetical protein